MSLTSFRATLAAVGIVPLVLVAVGLFGKTKHARAFLVVGVVMALAAILWTTREVHATVTAEEPTITWKPGVS